MSSYISKSLKRDEVMYQSIYTDGILLYVHGTGELIVVNSFVMTTLNIHVEYY